MKLQVWTKSLGWSSWCSDQNKPAMEDKGITGLNGFIMMALQYHGGNSMPNRCAEMPELEDLSQIVIHADTAASGEGVDEDGPAPFRIISGQFLKHPLHLLRNPGSTDSDSWIVVVPAV